MASMGACAYAAEAEGWRLPKCPGGPLDTGQTWQCLHVPAARHMVAGKGRLPGGQRGAGRQAGRAGGAYLWSSAASTMACAAVVVAAAASSSAPSVACDAPLLSTAAGSAAAPLSPPSAGRCQRRNWYQDSAPINALQDTEDGHSLWTSRPQRARLRLLFRAVLPPAHQTATSTIMVACFPCSMFVGLLYCMQRLVSCGAG